jgi:hypothetical protein
MIYYRGHEKICGKLPWISKTLRKCEQTRTTDGGTSTPSTQLCLLNISLSLECSLFDDFVCLFVCLCCVVLCCSLNLVHCWHSLKWNRNSQLITTTPKRLGFVSVLSFLPLFTYSSFISFDLLILCFEINRKSVLWSMIHPSNPKMHSVLSFFMRN